MGSSNYIGKPTFIRAGDISVVGLPSRIEGTKVFLEHAGFSHRLQSVSDLDGRGGGLTTAPKGLAIVEADIMFPIDLHGLAAPCKSRELELSVESIWEEFIGKRVVAAEESLTILGTLRNPEVEDSFFSPGLSPEFLVLEKAEQAGTHIFKERGRTHHFRPIQGGIVHLKCPKLLLLHEQNAG